MHRCEIKSVKELSEAEISEILLHWDVPEWKQLPPDNFRRLFDKNVFYLLKNADDRILAAARINHRFALRVNDVLHPFAELVGLVSIDRHKGYGSALLHFLVEDLRLRDIETVGFSHRGLRPFYEKNQVSIFYDKVRDLRECDGEEWRAPVDDDDLLDIHLSPEGRKLIESIGPENPAQLVLS